MKTQCVPKFLKGEISKYLCVIMRTHKQLDMWCLATPYMTKIMTIYDNIPKKKIIQSYTAADVGLNGYSPRPSEMFVRKWFRANKNTFCTDNNVKIYMDRYYPEGME